MYKAVEYFTDLQDNGYAYNEGDIYPHEGYEPSEQRINELASSDNKRGKPVIEEVKAASKMLEVPTTDGTSTADEDEKPKKGNKRK